MANEGNVWWALVLPNKAHTDYIELEDGQTVSIHFDASMLHLVGKRIRIAPHIHGDGSGDDICGYKYQGVDHNWCFTEEWVKILSIEEINQYPPAD